jgi:four helix bundle suffix protein
VAQLVYEGTVIFCDRSVDKRSRTHDQMVQAARSGARNIAEGSMASATSKKTELKLTGVARASLEELRLDYQGFLRHRDLPVWPKNSQEALAVRRRYQEDLAELFDGPDPPRDPYGIATASAETAANTMLCLTHQASYLVGRQLRSLDAAFVDEGGFTERLYRTRRQARGRDTSH